MPEAKFEFLPNDADENEGLSDAGIETFRDAPYTSTARECGQNSADASDGSGNAVTLHFNLRRVDSDLIPAIDKLRSTIECCLSKAKEGTSEKELDFFENAKRVISANQINILTIDDYYTRGLRGPCEPGTPFHSLVKAKGVSSDKEADSIGSFGIGKNAVFSVSDLQTVFYSTHYTDESTGVEHFLAQGKALLVSHVDENGDSKRATGYWGNKNYKPVENVSDVPDWMARKEQGTSVHAIGFRELEDWHHRMAASLIRNFFVAIHRNEMEFWVNDDQIVITRETLRELFSQPEILKAAADANFLDDFEFSRNLYDCLVSQESNRAVVSVEELGEVEVSVLARDGLPKRMCIVRNGMVITESLEKFGDKFAVFPMYRDFVALVEPKSQEGSALIKTLENPRHDGLSAERIGNPEKKNTAERAMKTLAKQIRSAIKDVTLSTPKEEEAIDELSEFFADDDHKPGIQDPDSDENPERYEYKPMQGATQSRKQPDSEEGGSEGGAGARGDGTGAGGSGSGGGEGEGKGGSGTKRRKRILNLESVRNTIPTGSRRERKIYFTSPETATIKLGINASGMADRETLDITSTNQGRLEKGFIEMQSKRGERVMLSVEFADAYAGPIELIAERVVD